MKRRHCALTLTVITIAIASLTGCKSTQSATKGASSSSTAQYTPLPVHAAAVTEAVKPWTSVKMPLSLKLTSPAKVTLSGSALMERGKALSISLRFMGLVEIGSLTIVDDTLLIIDKHNKKYISENIGALIGGMPLDLEDLQDLLLGRPFIIGNGALEDASLAVFDTADGSWSATTAVDSSWGYALIFNAADMLTKAILLKDGQGKALIEYHDSTADSPMGMMAEETAITVDIKPRIEGSLIWKTGRAEWGKANVSLPSVPAGYQRITLDKLGSIFQQL